MFVSLSVSVVVVPVCWTGCHSRWLVRVFFVCLFYLVGFFKKNNSHYFGLGVRKLYWPNLNHWKRLPDKSLFGGSEMWWDFNFLAELYIFLVHISPCLQKENSEHVSDVCRTGRMGENEPLYCPRQNLGSNRLSVLCSCLDWVSHNKAFLKKILITWEVHGHILWVVLKLAWRLL